MLTGKFITFRLNIPENQFKQLLKDDIKSWSNSAGIFSWPAELIQLCLSLV